MQVKGHLVPESFTPAELTQLVRAELAAIDTALLPLPSMVLTVDVALVVNVGERLRATLDTIAGRYFPSIGYPATDHMMRAVTGFAVWAHMRARVHAGRVRLTKMVHARFGICLIESISLILWFNGNLPIFSGSERFDAP